MKKMSNPPKCLAGKHLLKYKLVAACGAPTKKLEKILACQSFEGILNGSARKPCFFYYVGNFDTLFRVGSKAIED
jgi:hypothetical protein